jgi:threonine aldolase
MDHFIELRSDTKTLPTSQMREAMSQAQVGDDVYGEDPTVNSLERLAADKLGKEAALLTASGTMGNLVAVLTHCQRGDEMIVGDQSHIFHYEVGGVSALGGVHVRTIPNRGGTLDPRHVESAIRADNVHYPRSRLVCLENTHNRCGGMAVTIEQTDTVAEVAHANGCAVHMDGARLFNAAVALGVDPRRLVERCDSVSICLSKGLSAPVGSLLLGKASFIAEARRYRKMVGGGMRQAGVLAAAGIVALETMVDRLAVDHANAKALAEGIADLPGVSLDHAIQTNIVVIELDHPHLTVQDFVTRVAELGVKVHHFGGKRVRMVTHCGVDSSDIDLACRAIRTVLRGESQTR